MTQNEDIYVGQCFFLDLLNLHVWTLTTIKRQGILQLTWVEPHVG